MEKLAFINQHPFKFSVICLFLILYVFMGLKMKLSAIIRENPRLNEFISTATKCAFSGLMNSTFAIVLALFILVSANFVIHRNMTKNEIGHLLDAKELADPGFMPGDWYLNIPASHRLPFQMLMYPLSRNFSFITMSIVGRFFGFLFVCIGLGLLAKRMGLNVITASAAMGLFLVFDQSLPPGGEWIFRSIESKVIAYGLLFFALNALLNKKIAQAAFFSGLATTVHVLVGGWGSIALWLTILTERTATRRDLFTGILIWCVGGAGGIYFALSALLESSPDLPFNIEQIYVYFRNPHHLDPSRWKLHLDAFFLSATMIWFLARSGKFYPLKTEQRLIARFALWTIPPYLLGILIFPFSFAPKFLQYYPFRVGSTIVLLFGLMIAVAVISNHIFRTPAWQWLFAIVAIFFFWGGASGFVKDISELREFPEGALRGGKNKTHALYEACHWIRDNTEPGALLLASPRDEAIIYLSRRPVVAWFKHLPTAKANIAEWYQRLIDFNGGSRPQKTGFRASREIEENFYRLSETGYRYMAKKYGAKYLLINNRDDLDFPKLFSNKRYAIFKIESNDPKASEKVVDFHSPDSPKINDRAP